MTDLLKKKIRHVQDFPKAGILFYDIIASAKRRRDRPQTPRGETQARLALPDEDVADAVRRTRAREDAESPRLES